LIVDLGSAVDQVYAATPEDFMAVRTALVAQAREAKDRELAKQIGALRKPTRSAWLINVLARTAPEEIGGLLDLGDALRHAQANLAGPELRRLSGERQKAVAALGRRAAAEAAQQGHRATDGQLQEVSQHLQAALADPALAEDVRAGRVAQIVTFGGFGPWEATAPAPPPRQAPIRAGAEKGTSAPADAGADRPAGPTEAEIEAEIKAARAAAGQARASAAEAEAAAERADQAAERAAAEVERLGTELAAAEDDAARAAELRTATRQTASQTAAAAEAAEDALRTLLG
jgi:hypothetical protein